METAAASQALHVQELGGFQLLRELGQGGMGKVFLARQPSLEREVALKVLQPSLQNDAQSVLRFLAEARTAAKFQHPHVVGVYELGQDEPSGLHFIAFEFLAGGSVEQLLRQKGRLGELEALRIVLAVAQALQFAESQGLVHRDIKPENILLSSDGTPKLADLGLVKDVQGGAQVTQTGVVLGTPHYMAPEQALGDRPLDVRTDIYALGLCLWRCLTGLVPYDEERGCTVLQILNRHIHTDLVSVRERAPEVSQATAALIAEMCARDPDRRPAGAAALVEALTARVRELGATHASGAPARSTSARAAVQPVPATRPASQRALAATLPPPRAQPQEPAADPVAEDEDEPVDRTPALVLGGVLVLLALLLGVGLSLAFKRSPPDEVAGATPALPVGRPVGGEPAGGEPVGGEPVAGEAVAGAVQADPPPLAQEAAEQRATTELMAQGETEPRPAVSATPVGPPADVAPTLHTLVGRANVLRFQLRADVARGFQELEALELEYRPALAGWPDAERARAEELFRFGHLLIEAARPGADRSGLSRYLLEVGAGELRPAAPATADEISRLLEELGGREQRGLQGEPHQLLLVEVTRTLLASYLFRTELRTPGSTRQLVRDMIPLQLAKRGRRTLMDLIDLLGDFDQDAEAATQLARAAEGHGPLTRRAREWLEEAPRRLLGLLMAQDLLTLGTVVGHLQRDPSLGAAWGHAARVRIPGLPAPVLESRTASPDQLLGLPEPLRRAQRALLLPRSEELVRVTVLTGGRRACELEVDFARGTVQAGPQRLSCGAAQGLLIEARAGQLLLRPLTTPELLPSPGQPDLTLPVPGLPAQVEFQLPPGWHGEGLVVSIPPPPAQEQLGWKGLVEELRKQALERNDRLQGRRRN